MITYHVFNALAGLLDTVSILLSIISVLLSFDSTSASRNDASVVNKHQRGSIMRTLFLICYASFLDNSCSTYLKNEIRD